MLVLRDTFARFLCASSERNRSRQIVELTLIARKPRRNDVGDVEAKFSVQNEANEFSNPL